MSVCSNFWNILGYFGTFWSYESDVDNAGMSFRFLVSEQGIGCMSEQWSDGCYLYLCM